MSGEHEKHPDAPIASCGSRDGPDPVDDGPAGPGDPRARAAALGEAARLRAEADDIEGALALHEERLGVLDELGDRPERAAALDDIAQLRARAGDIEGALALHEERIRTFEQLGDQLSRAVALTDAADMRWESKEREGVIEAYQEALDVVRSFDDPGMTCQLLLYLASYQVAFGARAEGVSSLKEALAIAERLGAPTWAAHARTLLDFLET